MSDYSFMKTGSSLMVEKDNKPNDLFNLLELFTVNSLKNSNRYVNICERNGITSEDMKYGLIYEVFEFFKRNTNLEDLKQIEQDNLHTNSMDDDDKNDEEEDDEDDYIIPDDELDKFTRIDINKITNIDDREFVTKFLGYHDNWNDWEPTTIIEKSLKSSINKTYSL